MSANSQVARNQSRQTFDSVYESTNPITTIAGQRMVEWFSGHSLNTDRWGKAGNGSETIEMYDGIDGGVLLEPATDDSYRPVWISTGFSGSRTSSSIDTVKPFNPDGCSCIWVERWISGAIGTHTANAYCGGFAEKSGAGGSGANSAYWIGGQSLGTYQARGIASDSGQTGLDSGFTSTNNSVCFKLEVTGASGTATMIRGTINGLLETTQATGNFPSANMAWSCGIQGHNGAGYTANQRLVRYVEAWNH